MTDAYGGNIPPLDPYAAADWKLTRERESSDCGVCGAKAPARLAPDGCSECRTDFPRCALCGCWVGDGSGWLPGYVWVWFEDHDRRVCVRCFEETA